MQKSRLHTAVPALLRQSIQTIRIRTDVRTHHASLQPAEVVDVQKQDIEKTFEKPEVFNDPLQDSVTLEEKKAIYEVLKKLSGKVAKDGLEDIEFPFPADEEKEEEKEEEKAEDETEVEAEKEEEKPVFSMYIPTIDEDTPCVIRVDDKVQGNFFVSTYYKRKNTTIQVWRLTFEEKPVEGLIGQPVQHPDHNKNDEEGKQQPSPKNSRDVPPHHHHQQCVLNNAVHQAHKG